MCENKFRRKVLTVILFFMSDYLYKYRYYQTTFWNNETIISLLPCT